MEVMTRVRTEFLPYALPDIGEEEIAEVVQTLRSGWITTGPKTKEFERRMGDYLGVKHAIAVNSCTAALHVALAAIGVGRGDEVITSPLTFCATANAVVHLGGRPVFADIGDDLNIDPVEIERHITSRTKAIIPVHHSGQPCRMDEILACARAYNLPIIEDAAHAIGAVYHGRMVGTIGDVTAFSFYATKNMTTAEGGMIATDNDDLAEQMRLLSLHGISKDAWNRYSEKGKWYYEIENAGWKYNMTDIQAALGIPQIKKLDRFIEIRRRHADLYNNSLKGINGVITPFEDPRAKHIYHLYPLLLDEYNRDRFIENMNDNGIGCSVHFIPLHLHPYYRSMGFKKGDYPNAEWVYEREVSLPLYPKMTIEDVNYVINGVEGLLEEQG